MPASRLWGIIQPQGLPEQALYCSYSYPLQTQPVHADTEAEIDVDIDVECTFCSKNFTNLRRFTTHLDTICKEKKFLKESKAEFSRQQRKTVQLKQDLLLKSTERLNRELGERTGMLIEGSGTARGDRGVKRSHGEIR